MPEAAALFWLAAASRWRIAPTLAVSGCPSYNEPIHNFENHSSTASARLTFAGTSFQSLPRASLLTFRGNELVAPPAAHLEYSKAEIRKLALTRDEKKIAKRNDQSNKEFSYGIHSHVTSRATQAAQCLASNSFFRRKTTFQSKCTVLGSVYTQLVVFVKKAFV